MQEKQNRQEINIRLAERDDVPDIVHLLADDFLGSQREQLKGQPADGYYSAFDDIKNDSNNELVVVESGNQIIGTFQITYIPSLTYQGGWRAQIEAVRVKENLRGMGIGRLAMLWAIRRARDRGCRLVQLTTNKQRSEALSFYQQLGFINSHEGLKLYLS